MSKITSIPETGGANRSPIRDDFIKLVIGVINLDEDAKIHTSLMKTLQSLYSPNCEWETLLNDTLDFFKNDTIVPVIFNKAESIAEKVSHKLVPFIVNYLESYGVVFDETKILLLVEEISKMKITKVEEFQRYLSLQRMIGNIEKLKSHGLLIGYYEDNTTFKDGLCRVFQDFVIITWNSNRKSSIFMYNALLSIRDMLLKRAIAKFIGSTNFNFLGSRYPSIDTVNSVIDWGDVVLKEGNAMYSMIASYESLLTGIIISKFDNFENIDFSLVIEKSLMVNENDERKDALERMIKSLEQEGDAELVQCFSLFKLWSYPIVNEEEAMQTLIEYGKNKKPVSQVVMKILDRLARRQYFTHYVLIHNVLPKNAKYLGNEGDYLYRVVNGYEKFDYRYRNPDYSFDQWSDVKLPGSLEPILDADIGSYMKDKSISPELSQLWRVYQREYIPDEIKSTLGCSVRSGIMRYIKGDIMSAYQLIDYVSKFGADEAWKVVGVTAKEKEHKPSARLFAMLVLHMKLWFAITEDCLKSALFKYFPQQSMDQTSSQSSYKKSVMSSNLPGEYLKIVMNVDFSKWNTTFRDENTFCVFLFIDEVFDFKNVYTYTHQFFRNCRVYLSSRYSVPEVLKSCKTYEESISPDTNCDLWFHGFLGGFEGQRQKGWTLVTLLFMMYVIEIKAGIRYYTLYGQGDNQVIVFMLKRSNPKEEIGNRISDADERMIKRHIDLVRKCLSEGCDEIGLKVKTAETWFSSSFFQYSKDFYINGARMPLDMKQLMTLSPHNKLIVPTQFDIYKMLLSSVNACFDTSHSLIPTYFIGMYLSNILILVDDYVYDRRPTQKVLNVYKSENINIPERLVLKGGSKLLEMMSKIPSSLGGTSDISLSNLLVKGSGDYIEGAIDCLIRSKCFYCMQYLKTMPTKSMQQESMTDKSILLKNPLAINLRIITVEGETLPDAVMRYLEENAGGDIKIALENFRSYEKTKFKKSLVNEGKSFCPMLSKLLYDISVFSSVERQMEKVDGSTITRRSGVTLVSFMNGVHLSNSKKLKFFKQRLSHRDEQSPDIGNSKYYAQHLRKYWYIGNYPIHSSKHIPMLAIRSVDSDEELPVLPSALLKIKDLDPRICNPTRGLGKHPTQHSNMEEFHTTGIELPNGVTKNSIESLCDILPSYCGKDSKLHLKVKSQLKTVTNYNIDYSIDWTHTKRPYMREVASIPSASNFFTHCSFSVSEGVHDLSTAFEKFEFEKVKVASVSLANIQYNVCSEIDLPSDSYWVIYDKRSKVPKPAKNYDFDPTTLSLPNSHIYYVESQAELSYSENISRKMDDILSLTLLFDSCLSYEGFLDFTGVRGRPLTQSILRFDAELSFTLFVIRFLIAIDESIQLSTDEFEEILERHKKAIHEIFKRYLSDDGVHCLSKSGLGEHLRVRYKSGLILSLILLSYRRLIGIFRQDSTLFVRLTALYEYGDYRTNEMTKKALGYLSRCAEINSDLKSIQEFYGSTMTNYGRKDNIPSIPYRSRVRKDDYPNVFLPATGPACELKEYSWNVTNLARALGLYFATLSVLDQFMYRIVVIHIPQISDPAIEYITSLSRFMKGRKALEASDVTLLFVNDENMKYYGIHRLALENVILKGANPEDLEDILGLKTLHIASAFSLHLFKDESDCLYIGAHGYYNVASLFCSGISLNFKEENVRSHIPEKFNLKLYFPDWALKQIVFDDMRAITNGEYNGLITSDSIYAYLKEECEEVKQDALIQKYGDLEQISRVLLASKSIHLVRIHLISCRIGISQHVLSQFGSVEYMEDVPFQVKLNRYIEN